MQNTTQGPTHGFCASTLVVLHGSESVLTPSEYERLRVSESPVDAVGESKVRIDAHAALVGDAAAQQLFKATIEAALVRPLAHPRAGHVRLDLDDLAR